MKAELWRAVATDADRALHETLMGAVRELELATAEAMVEIEARKLPRFEQDDRRFTDRRVACARRSHGVDDG